MKSFAKIVGLIYLGVLAAVMAPAQTISGTVIDKGGVTWTNAVIHAHLRNPSGSKALVKATLVPVVTEVIANTASNGTFTLGLLNTSNIIPLGTVWDVSVCPFTDGVNCQLIVSLYQQGTQDISAMIAATLIPPFTSGFTLQGAYADSELTKSTFGYCYLTAVPNIRCSTGFNGFFTLGNPTFQTNGVTNPSQNTLNISGGVGISVTNPSAGNVQIVNTGIPTFQTNGVTNPSQSTLNVSGGVGISVTNPSAGNVQIVSTIPLPSTLLASNNTWTGKQGFTGGFTNTAGFQEATGAGCTTAAAVLASCVATITLSPVEPDLLYSVKGCQLNGTSNAFIANATSFTTSTFIVAEFSATATAATGGTIICQVVHN